MMFNSEKSGSNKEPRPIPTDQILKLQDKALNTSSLGMVIADVNDPALSIVYSNATFTRFAREYPLADPCSLLELWEDCDVESGSFDRALEDLSVGKNLSVITRLKTSEENWCWRQWVLSPVRQEDNRLTHLVAVLIDITDQRMAENELRKISAELEERIQERTAALERINQDLEGFTYSVSHDLRAPLRAIMGFSKVLVEDYGREVDSEMRQTLDRINAAANRMTTIIEDLLSFSRLGRKEMVRQRTSLSEMAEAIGADLVRRHPNRDTRVLFDEDVEVMGDPTLIRMALENLLDNAYKFTSKRKSGVVEFRKLAEHRFVVKDNGAGFDPRFADKLFRPFERLHSASEFPGTGIGLANVRRIIERHGGKIWAENNAGEGASFYFEI